MSKELEITAFGITMPVSEWAGAVNIPEKVLAERILAGWNPEAAVSEKHLPSEMEEKKVASPRTKKKTSKRTSKKNPLKRWSLVTEKELGTLKGKKCSKCPYRGYFSFADASPGRGAYAHVSCEYLIKTGKSRGVDPRECMHYLDKNVVRKENVWGKTGPAPN